MQPSWDRLCGHARSVSACAACPSALHGYTSSAGSTPDEPAGGSVVVLDYYTHGKHIRCSLFTLYTLHRISDFLKIAE